MILRAIAVTALALGALGLLTAAANTAFHQIRSWRRERWLDERIVRGLWR